MKKPSTPSTSASKKKVANKAPAKKAPATKAPAKKALANKVPAKKAPAEKESAGASGAAASKLIDQRIVELGDWRGATLSRLRKLIHEAAPQVTEEWKWMGTPCWYQDGGICTGESYKQVVKLTFFRGAFLPDPKKLFNSSMEGNLRRAIDFRENEKINEAAFKALIKAAATANAEAKSAKK
jgi:hypothetical protein